MTIKEICIHGMDDKWQVGEGVEAQARLVFQNLQNILREAGGSLDDVMELTTAAYSRKGR